MTAVMKNCLQISIQLQVDIKEITTICCFEDQDQQTSLGCKFWPTGSGKCMFIFTLPLLDQTMMRYARHSSFSIYSPFNLWVFKSIFLLSLKLDHKVNLISDAYLPANKQNFHSFCRSFSLLLRPKTISSNLNNPDFAVRKYKPKCIVYELKRLPI